LQVSSGKLKVDMLAIFVEDMIAVIREFAGEHWLKVNEAAKERLRQNLRDRVNAYKQLLEQPQSQALPSARGPPRKGISRKESKSALAKEKETENVFVEITFPPAKFDLARRLHEMVLIFLKTTARYVDAAESVDEEMQAAATELWADLQACARQMAAQVALIERIRIESDTANEVLASLWASLAAELKQGVEGSPLPLNDERLYLTNAIIYTRKLVLEHVEALCESLQAIASMLLSYASEPSHDIPVQRMQLVMIARHFIRSLRLVMSHLVTAQLLAKKAEEDNESPAIEETKSESIWGAAPDPDDPDIDKNDPFVFTAPFESHSNSFRPGSLNSVLTRLTDGSLTVGRIDSLLYGSFRMASPQVLVNKLIERAKVPKKVIAADSNKAAAIREAALKLLACLVRKELPFIAPALLRDVKKFGEALRLSDPSFSEEFINVIHSIKVAPRFPFSD